MIWLESQPRICLLGRGSPNRLKELHALLNPGIVEHEQRRRQLDGGALGTGVDDEVRLAVRSGVEDTDLQCGIAGQRLQPIAADDPVAWYFWR